MATSGSIREFFDSSSTRWDFPRIEDHTPDTEEPDDKPPRAPQLVRWGTTALIGLTAVSIVLLGVGAVSRSLGAEQVVASTSIDTETGLHGSEEIRAELIVYVSGAVATPGVITLSEGDRVHQAIEQAGGALSDADLSAVNLARLVVDGEQLVVPRQGDPPVAQVGSSSSLLSLSLATTEQLQTLPGIGPALAQRIVDWRETHGPFRHVDDVTAVDGIGPATLERFRDRVIP